MELPCSFLTPADLWVALFSFGPVLLLGVPAVLKTRQPREIALEPVADEALPASLRRWLTGLDARFSALGYQVAGTWRVTNFPKGQTAVMRSWWSSSEAPVASASTLLHVNENSQLGQSWLEFSTLHADGGGVQGRRRVCPAHGTPLACGSLRAPLRGACGNTWGALSA